MNSSIIPFTFAAFTVRTQMDDHGSPWFNANDVCEALEFANPRTALDNHVDQDDVLKADIIDALGRTQEANFVNESGLYSLIFGSPKEAAKKFKRWVTSEVLPALRKHGMYGKADLKSQIQLRNQSLTVLQRLQTCNDAFVKSTLLDHLRTIHINLGQALPAENLLGKDPKQIQIEM